MITSIIVDDELKGREALESLLHRYFSNVRVLATCSSVVQAEEFIREHKPHLIFLDIEMPHYSGFDLLEKIKDIEIDVIFTTAYDQYAVKAFRFCALDYLLKPIDKDDLEQALQKLERKKQQKKGDNKIHMEALVAHLNGKKKRIAIPDKEGLIFVDIDEIIRCTAESNYTDFFLTNGKKLTSSKTLKEYEELLREENFFRVHNSHLVNLSHVKKYIRGKGGYLLTSDNVSIEVSSRKKIALLQILGV